MVQDTTNSNNMPQGRIGIKELTGDIANLTAGKPPRAIQKTQKKRNTFPLEVLPLRAQEYMKGAETALGIPKDFFGASMLFAAAAAAGNTIELEVKKGEVQKAVFYMVLVGLPNSNKSGGLKAGIKPLSKQDAYNYQLYKEQKAAYETEQAKPRKEREEVDNPSFDRVIIQDATPEAVASALQDSPRGITIYRDELAGFLKDFNRYNQGGEQEFWLSNWSGITLSVDRKTSEPIRIPNPFMGIIGTIQPGVIEEMAKGVRTINGFMDRFIFVWPEGLKKTEWTEDEISLDSVGDYETAVEKLLALDFDSEKKANRLTLTTEARKQLFRFFNEDNKPLCDNAENELLGGIYGKFDFHTSRFVIALHLIHWAYSKEEGLPLVVEAKTVGQAIKVAEYFRTQALKVYNAIHQASPVEKLPANYRRLYEVLPELFKTGDGEAIAKAQGIPKRTFRKLLAQQKGILFEKVKHGEYSKIL